MSIELVILCVAAGAFLLMVGQPLLNLFRGFRAQQTTAIPTSPSSDELALYHRRALKSAQHQLARELFVRSHMLAPARAFELAEQFYDLAEQDGGSE